MNRATINTLTFLGLLCIICGVGLLGFFLFLIPYFFFHLQYDVPTFISYFSNWLEVNHGIGGYLQVSLIFVPPLVAAILFFALARLITTEIEKGEKHRADETDEPLHTKELLGGAKPSYPPKYRVYPVVKVLIYIILLIVVLALLEFAITLQFKGLF